MIVKFLQSVVVIAFAWAAVPASAQVKLGAVLEWCVAASQAQAPVAGPFTLRRISSAPDNYLGEVETDVGIVSVMMVVNKVDSPTRVVCSVSGAKMRTAFEAESLTVLWSDAEPSLMASFTDLSKGKDFKVTRGALEDSSLGVVGPEMIKCGDTSAHYSFGPHYISDSSYLFPSFSLNDMDGATFSTVLIAPMFVPMHTKFCK